MAPINGRFFLLSLMELPDKTHINGLMQDCSNSSSYCSLALSHLYSIYMYNYPTDKSKCFLWVSQWPGLSTSTVCVINMCHQQAGKANGKWNVKLYIFCKISNVRGTKSQNLDNSHLVLQLSLPNPLKPGVKSRMKVQLEQRWQAMLQLHMSDQQFYCLPEN